MIWQTIRSGISTLFTFYLTHRQEPIRCYHSWPEYIWKWWQWGVTSHSPKLQHHRSLTIRFFSVISRTLVGGGLTPLQRWSQCIQQPHPTEPQDRRDWGSYPSAEMQSVYFTAPPSSWLGTLSSISCIILLVVVVVVVFPTLIKSHNKYDGENKDVQKSFENLVNAINKLRNHFS